MKCFEKEDDGFKSLKVVNPQSQRSKVNGKVKVSKFSIP